jgi:hypothetical protein
MSVTLETLEMTGAELDRARDAVRTMAYFKWLDAGCPDGGQSEFWLKAQREWIERCYVPHRSCDGARPTPEPNLVLGSGVKGLERCHPSQRPQSLGPIKA